MLLARNANKGFVVGCSACWVRPWSTIWLSDKSHLPRSLKGSRAAQYLRVSTDSQKYSIENQAAALAAYAARRSIKIVKSYADRGRHSHSLLRR
ncbi:MAG: recombinase family protein [Devosia sp.]|uniref:recombinase family protein n=1 Tax=Devosia sp. TaxID=1871048 RepID=UPI003392A3E0